MSGFSCLVKVVKKGIAQRPIPGDVFYVQLYRCHAQRSKLIPSRSRFVAVTSDPTSPVPASTLKFTKSIELPLLREILLAAAMVAPFAAEVKKVCSEL